MGFPEKKANLKIATEVGVRWGFRGEDTEKML
jgi:hypothetical protein